jgi:hypothetical protein
LKSIAPEHIYLATIFCTLQLLQAHGPSVIFKTYSVWPSRTKHVIQHRRNHALNAESTLRTTQEHRIHSVFSSNMCLHVSIQ